ncbi:hypothetical protein HaLaN_25966, partial [Haematococcus lacustris]
MAAGKSAHQPEQPASFALMSCTVLRKNRCKTLKDRSEFIRGAANGGGDPINNVREGKGGGRRGKRGWEVFSDDDFTLL